jgi:hypothetical protein
MANENETVSIPVKDCQVSMGYSTLSQRLGEVSKAMCEGHAAEAAYLMGRLHSDVEQRRMHDAVLAMVNHPKAIPGVSTTPIHQGPSEDPPRPKASPDGGRRERLRDAAPDMLNLLTDLVETAEQQRRIGLFPFDDAWTGVVMRAKAILDHVGASRMDMDRYHREWSESLPDRRPR